MLTHFLATDAWPDAAIHALLDEAAALKRDPRGGERLAGRVVALVFLDPSLRTRTSFEVAIAREGGRTVVLEPGRGAWPLESRRGVVMDGDAVEHLVEAARVLGRYVDAIGVRSFPKETSWAEAREEGIVRGFAEHAGVPVVNLESARRHPCQGLADAMTLRGRFPEGTRGRRLVLAWTWHPKPLPIAVPVSAAIAAATVGMDVTLAYPPGYAFDPDDLEVLRGVAARNGGRVEIAHDLDEAVRDADAVYAKSWGSLAHFGDPEAERTLRAGARGWIVDERRMRATRGASGAFLHCLPVRRGVEVADGVLDGPWSLVVDQAENRLHAQRALMRRLLGERG